MENTLLNMGWFGVKPPLFWKYPYVPGTCECRLYFWLLFGTLQNKQPTSNQNKGPHLGSRYKKTWNKDKRDATLGPNATKILNLTKSEMAEVWPFNWPAFFVWTFFVPSLKLTVRHGKSTILMVFTRKDWIFMGYVSFREGNCCFAFWCLVCHWRSSGHFKAVDSSTHKGGEQVVLREQICELKKRCLDDHPS